MVHLLRHFLCLKPKLALQKNVFEDKPLIYLYKPTPEHPYNNLFTSCNI